MNEIDKAQESLPTYSSALEFFGLNDGYTKEELYNKTEALERLDYTEELDKSLIVLERNIGIYNTDEYSYYYALIFFNLNDGYTKEELYNRIDESILWIYKGFKKCLIILERKIGIYNTDEYSYYYALKFFHLKDGYTKEELYNKVKDLEISGYKEEYNECIIILEKNLELRKSENKTGKKLIK